MRYLIDTNVLIEARDRYYSFEMVPGFWVWLEAQHSEGILFSVTKVREELMGRKDDLEHWVKGLPTSFFLEPDGATFSAMGDLSDWATNHHNYRDLAVQTFLASADYVLAAHACAHGYTVVSQEEPAPDAKKSIKLPDACNAIGVNCLQTFRWLRECQPRF